jgi:hypothetical protein
MKRRDYMKPKMKVFEVKQTGMLMQSGNLDKRGGAGLQDYGWHDEGEE